MLRQYSLSFTLCKCPIMNELCDYVRLAFLLAESWILS